MPINDLDSADLTLPGEVQAIVVGGGIVGCSVAYHLAQLGFTRVLLLEQNKLAGGTTWHSAGQVGLLRTSHTMTQVNKYSAKLYAGLEAETGLPTGWTPTGSLLLAITPDRITQIHRMLATADLLGVEAHFIDRDVVKSKWPLMNVDDVLSALWIPGDGKVDPTQTTIALAAAARQQGATVVEGVRVTKLLRYGKKIVGVETSHGTIQAGTVVLCGGMWSRQLAHECGLNLPLWPVEHHYVVSNPIEGMHDQLPNIRDPDGYIYIRPLGNQVMLGGFQAMSIPWKIERVPDDFSFALLEDDWPQFAPPLARGQMRMPFLPSVGIERFVNGPESFTPDNHFLLGPLAGVEGCYTASGFNSAGIACAGGAGKLLAEWIVNGEAPCDLGSVDPRRFGPCHNNRTFLMDRTSEVLGWHYALAWPNREPLTGRDLRRSPLHEELSAAGACFGQQMGWERPLFFADSAANAKIDYAWGRQNWFDFSAAEHHATRQRVAIYDQTSLGKLLVEGPDAQKLLAWVCAANVDIPLGSIAYSPLLNTRGTLTGEVLIARQAEDRFYLTISSGQMVRIFDWIGRQVHDARVTLTDLTSSLGVLGVMGPNSRALLQQVCSTPFDDASFPPGTAQPIELAHTTAWAYRTSYVGELGWELHLPIEQLTAADRQLCGVGNGLGLTRAGYYAMNTLRLEKGYAAWGLELSADESPREAGLAKTVNLAKDFLGKSAYEQRLQGPQPKCLLIFVVDNAAAMPWGVEPIWRDGRKVGLTTSGGFGHSLCAGVAMGYVPMEPGESRQSVCQSHFELEISGTRYRARAYTQSPLQG
jgi:4-methylaminobutanoate oxidase (formaldehyde-forming)